MVVEELLQLLISEVDAQLFKGVELEKRFTVSVFLLTAKLTNVEMLVMCT